MAIFTALAFFFPATFGPTAAWLAGSVRATQAVLAVGQTVTWSLASQALSRQSMPSQKVQATISQTDAPRVRGYGRVLLGGLRAFYEAEDGNLYQVIVLHHGRVHGLVAFWVDGETVTVNGDGAVTSGNYDSGGSSPDLQLQFRDGSGQGGDYAIVRSNWPALWTAAHRLDGQATLLAVMNHPGERIAEVFPKGPHTAFQAEVQASRVLNMVGESVYSENAALCIRDYLTHKDGWRIPAGTIDTDAFAAFTARCAEPVPLAGGGTEPRYRICGTYSLDDAPKDVASRMLAACDGQIYQTPEGKAGILGGGWSEPDVTITAADILSLSVQDGRDPFEDFNLLKGQYLSPAHEYQPTEVPDIRDPASLAEQGERVEQIDIDMCPSGTQMQRLMRIVWAKRRREMTGTLTTNLVGLKARFPKGDGIHTIRLSAPEFGIAGVFEVTSHRFSIPDGWCEIGIASIANPYPWDISDERALPPTPAQAGKHINATPAPTGASLTQVPVRVSGDTYGGKLRLTVNSVTRNDLTLQAQVATGDVPVTHAGPWTAMGGDRFSAETGILQNEQVYTVRYRWRGQTAWQRAGAVTIVANPNVPSAPTGFARVGASGVTLTWTNPADNFWKARLFRGATTSFADASFVKDVAGLAGETAQTTHSPGAGTHRYWVVALNGSSVASLPAGPVTITI